MDLPFELLTETDLDVCAFGTNAVDHVIRVPSFPAFGSKIELTDHMTLPGGEAASTLVGLTRLGWRTSYAGRFGDDEEGKIGLRSLDGEGVDSSYAETMPGARTQIAYILVDEGTGERTVIWKRDRELAYDADEAPLELISSTRILHLTPHDGAACIELAAQAKSAGVIVSLDVDNTFAKIEDLLPLVDICISSAEFPTLLTGEKELDRAVKKIAELYGCRIVGATAGSAGSLVYCSGEHIESPGYPVPGGCIDTTGAGDAFRAGFLHGVLLGVSVEQCSSIANATAALKCRGYGARNSLPRRDELDRFVFEPADQ